MAIFHLGAIFVPLRVMVLCCLLGGNRSGSALSSQLLSFYFVLNKVLPCLRLVHAVLDLNQQLLHLFLWNVVDFKQFILYKLGFRIIK